MVFYDFYLVSYMLMIIFLPFLIHQRFCRCVVPPPLIYFVHPSVCIVSTKYIAQCQSLFLVLLCCTFVTVFLLFVSCFLVLHHSISICRLYLFPFRKARVIVLIIFNTIFTACKLKRESEREKKQNWFGSLCCLI